jgi:SAM-dependent methyltransferase
MSGVHPLARGEPFDLHAERYDAWFERHHAAYVSELLALRPFVPLDGRGLEIGVGSGRFAAPLGIGVGVDPAIAMLARACARGVDVVAATAERLPFARESFDHVLVVTTLCFVDDPSATLAEVRRVLRPGGSLVIGFIDGDTALGREYARRRAESAFYRDATFRTAGEVDRLVCDAGFAVVAWAQTLTRAPDEIAEIEPASPGRGRGGFAVLHARLDAPPP